MDDLVGKSLLGQIDEEEALQYYKQAKDPIKAIELFKAAYLVRNTVIGEKFTITAPTGLLLPCKIEPHCNYCTAWKEKTVDLNKVLKGTEVLINMGVNKVLIVGGARLEGYDKEILEIVSVISNASDINIEINFGGSITIDTLRKLKEMGISGVTASLETFNKDIFYNAKPGDDLDKRKKLFEAADREGIPIRSFMLIGLGESDEDRIHQLYYLRQFKQLQHLMISPFTPYKDTPYEDFKPCPTWEIARTTAISRLIMPDINITLSSRTNYNSYPLWYLAGGGNELFGMAISKIKNMNKRPGEDIIPFLEDAAIINRIPAIKNQLEHMNVNLIFD
jgi:biotin synthase